VRKLKRTISTDLPRAHVRARAAKPLLMVDIDGVISLFGFPLHAAPAGSFHSIEGIPHFLSSAAGTHLLALSSLFELVWASGWEERANEHLPHLLGLPAPLPFLRFDRPAPAAPALTAALSPAPAPPTPASAPAGPGTGAVVTHAHWKLDAIETFAAGRPLAWIDDAFNPACHEWASARRSPTLLVRTSPATGLTARETESLVAWARELASAEG
jgi:hypothetical protein